MILLRYTITEYNTFKLTLLPSHYLSTHYLRMMRAYLSDYLKEEIQAEGLVRNLPGFARHRLLIEVT